MSVRNAIDKLGGVRPLALKLGHNHETTVRLWYKNDRLPKWRVREVLDAAEEQGVDISADLE